MPWIVILSQTRCNSLFIHLYFGIFRIIYFWFCKFIAVSVHFNKFWWISKDKQVRINKPLERKIIFCFWFITQSDGAKYILVRSHYALLSKLVSLFFHLIYFYLFFDRTQTRAHRFTISQFVYSTYLTSVLNRFRPIPFEI